MKPDTPKSITAKEALDNLHTFLMTQIDMGGHQFSNVVFWFNTIAEEIAAAPKPDCAGVEEIKNKILRDMAAEGYDVGFVANKAIERFIVAVGLLAVKEKPEISDESGDLHIAYMLGFERGRESVKEKVKGEIREQYGYVTPEHEYVAPEHRTDANEKAQDDSSLGISSLLTLNGEQAKIISELHAEIEELKKHDARQWPFTPLDPIVEILPVGDYVGGGGGSGHPDPYIDEELK